MRHEHKPVPESTPERVVYAALQDIQRLCARGAELDQIWERAEKAIEQAKSRH
jgi:hypothetical protein